MAEGDKVRDIDISCDGTWMTPGHSSVIGVATTIGCATGKVLDTGTRSKQCKSWKPGVNGINIVICTEGGLLNTVISAP